jgi:hypothetical protein
MFDINGKRRLSLNFREVVQTKKMTCFTYIPRFHIYLVASMDFRLFIFSEYFDLFKIFPLGMHRVQALQYLDQKNELLVCSVDKFILMDFKVKAKYDISKVAVLDPSGQSIQFELKEKMIINLNMTWVKRMKIDPTRIITWNDNSVCVNLLHDYST